jgi:probable F420-dependent oxidoreductase
MAMKLGLFGINLDLCARDPEVLVRTATAAEDAGWESVWTGEHYVLPAVFAPPSPAPGDFPHLDPFVALTLAASRTSTLLLGTGVTVVPMHQPLALAKRVASLDVVSGGRVLFGLGVGYLESEFRALGAPFDHRGERTMEHLAAMRAIWNDDSATFAGRFVSFDGLRAEPRPVQRPSPPLHFGGHVEVSFRRSVEHGHGWFGYALDLEGIERCVAGLALAAKEVDRPAHLPRLEVSVTPHPTMVLDGPTVERLGQLGVDRLIVLPPGRVRRGAEEMQRYLETLPAQLDG